MKKIDSLPMKEINNSKNSLNLIDKTNILGKYNPFISLVFGIMNYFELNKNNSVILECGSNPIGDSSIYYLAPNVCYFFANHPTTIDYYGFDINVDDNYMSLIKEKIQENNKCTYYINPNKMFENLKNQLLFSYESLKQKKQEIEREGKKAVIISSFVLGSTFDSTIHFKNDFWNLNNSLQIHRFALDDFVKNYNDEQEHNFIPQTPYIEAEYQDYIRKKMKSFSQTNLKKEENRFSFLKKRLQEIYSLNGTYKFFDCPFEKGYSIGVLNTLK